MKVASVNFYVGNRQPEKDAQLLNSLEIDSIGFQEGHAHVDALNKHLHKTRLCWKRTGEKASREVMIGVNYGRNRLHNFTGREVSSVDPKDETEVFKNRWITVVEFTHHKDGRRYAHINYHGNAAVQDSRTGKLLEAKRVYQWLRAARIIARIIKRLQKRGSRILVTGDFNYRRFSVAGFSLDFWSPQRMFKRLGLEFVENRLDYVAWSKSLRKKKVTKIDHSRTGADHDWIIVELA